MQIVLVFLMKVKVICNFYILSTGNELPAWYREPELVSAGESSEYAVEHLTGVCSFGTFLEDFFEKIHKITGLLQLFLKRDNFKENLVFREQNFVYMNIQAEVCHFCHLA